MALLLGLLLSVTSSLCGFTALNLQKLAQNKDKPRPALNLAGVGLGMVVGPMDMVAYSCAPQSLLAPVGTLSLVFNLVAAPIVHGDKVTPRDISATALIIIGTALCLVYGARGDDESKEQTTAPAGPDSYSLMCYAALVGLLILALVSVLFVRREVGGHADASANAILAGLLGSTTVVASKVIGAAASSADRSVLTVVRSAVPLVALVPCHLYTLNRGMGRHSSLIMVPGAAAAGLLSNVTSGFLLYGEEPTSAAFFGLGVLLLLGGVLTLCAPKGLPVPQPPPALKRGISGAEKGVLSNHLEEDNYQVDAHARRRLRTGSQAQLNLFPNSRLMAA